MKTSPKRATHADIARVAHVSNAAVSLALRNHPSIPPKTCQRIQRIADRIGYRPDPTLSRMMAQVRRSGGRPLSATLGLLTAFDRRAPWENNPYLARAHRGLTTRADRLGYRVEEHWLREPGMSPTRLRQVMVARGIEGLIVLGTPAWVESLEFDFSRFAVATIGYSVRVGFHRVAQHQFQEMFQVLRQLDALGYSRVGLVLTEDSDERTFHHYSSAMLWSQLRWPEERRVPILTAARIDAAVFSTWFERHQPDVVIAQNPSPIDIAEWLRRLGSPVPQRCGLVSLDIDPGYRVNFSGIIQDYDSVAAAAIDNVAAQLVRNERGIPQVPKTTLIEGVWRDGDTTRPQRPRQQRPLAR